MICNEMSLHDFNERQNEAKVGSFGRIFTCPTKLEFVFLAKKFSTIIWDPYIVQKLSNKQFNVPSKFSISFLQKNQINQKSDFVPFSSKLW